MDEVLVVLGLFFLSILLIPETVFSYNTQINIEVESPYALVYHLNENKVMFSKNSEERIAIASLTKVMTALVAVDLIEDMDATLTIESEWFYGLKEANASVAGFYDKEQVTYRDLLYGTLLPSGADAVRALIYSLTKNEEEYLERMNQKAQEWGLKNTKFQDPIGLDKTDQYSTLSDFLTLFIKAIENPLLKEIMSTKTYQTSNGKHLFTSTIQKMIQKLPLSMDYLGGGKTGYTYQAGRCLATFSEYQGSTYIVIVAGAEGNNHILDTDKIYRYLFESYGYVTVLKKGTPIITIDGIDQYPKKVIIKADRDYSFYLPLDYSLEQLTYEYKGRDSVSFHTKKGTYLGEYLILYENEQISSIPIHLEEEGKFNIWLWFLHHFYRIVFLLIIFGAGIVVWKKWRY